MPCVFVKYFCILSLILLKLATEHLHIQARNLEEIFFNRLFDKLGLLGGHTFKI